MSLDADLQATLAALTSERTFVDGAIDLGPAGADEALVHALRLMDTIVLPRVLEFRVGAASVSVEIGGRRLRSLVAHAGPLPDLSALQGQLLSADHPEALAALGDAFRSLILSEGHLLVARKPSEGAQAGAVDGGVSIDYLARAWEIDLDTRPPTDIERFCLALGQDLQAMLVIKNGAVETGLGEESLQSALQDLWSDKVATFDPSFAVFGLENQPKMVFCQKGLLPDDLALCFVKVNEISILSAVSGDGLGPVATAWMDIHA